MYLQDWIELACFSAHLLPTAAFRDSESNTWVIVLGIAEPLKRPALAYTTAPKIGY